MFSGYIHLKVVRGGLLGPRSVDAFKIRLFEPVGINHDDLSDSRPGKHLDHSRTCATGPYHGHCRVA